MALLKENVALSINLGFKFLNDNRNYIGAKA